MKEPQTITVTFVFPVELTPGTADHLYQVLKSEFQSKGYTLNEDLTVRLGAPIGQN